MKLYLNELHEMNADRTYSVELSSEPVEFHGQMYTPTSSPVLTLSLHRDGATIMVVGELTGKWVTQCSRCLRPSALDLNTAFEDMWFVDRSETEAEHFFASSFVEDDGTSINLSEYGSELLFEHLPMRVLCSTECRGLCSTCGANLNFEECSCGKRAIDPRLAVLGRLLNDKGGVRDGTT